MGVDCVRGTSPVSFWLHHRPVDHVAGDPAPPEAAGRSTGMSASPRTVADGGDSMPDMKRVLAGGAEMARRASSFPNVDPTLAKTSPIKVRSQSESAALNNLKVSPRNTFEFEMCRQQWRCTGSSASCCSSSPATTFFTPQNDIQSDSEGDDSLVSSSEEGGCSSTDGIDAVGHDDDEEDLGVVRDLELYDRDIDTNKSYRFHNQHQQQQQQYLIAAAAGGGSDATTPLVGSPSSASAAAASAMVASSTMMAAMAAAAATIASSPTSSSSSSAAMAASSASSTSTTAAAATNGFTGLPTLSKKQLDASINRLAILAAIQSKKAVRFADECGKCLETVRVMTEPSDYPPLINPAVIRRFRKAASLAALAAAAGDPSQVSANTGDDDDDDEDAEALAALKAPRSSWKITFRQPASEYVKFRDTLEHQKVALENVMLKNDVGRMVGTIKVANVAFEKRVFIRLTADGWKTHIDRPAVYQSSPSKAYDTFRFDIDIPRDTKTNARIDFCVCFEANGGGEGNTYWDSNEGKNFVLTASDYDQFPSTTSTAPMPIKSPLVSSSSAVSGSPAFGSPRNVDAYSMNYDNWAKFASWRNLRTDTPYW